MVFLFENLEVYKKAMELTANVYSFTGTLKNKTIKDQLERASLSISLNIAEGQGRIHSKEKRQFYNTARGSLLESVALLQVCSRINILDKEQYMQLYFLSDEIGKMLNGLIKSVNLQNTFNQ